MNKLEALLDAQPVLLGDGAMGTMLFAVGLKAGQSPELWNVEQAEKVIAVHRGYAEAGSNLVLTNTFGGNRFRLKFAGLEDRVEELNKAAVQNVKTAIANVDQPVLIGGSIGPSGELLQPLGLLDPAEAEDAFAAQAQALAEGGVDYFQVETFGDLGEQEAALRGVRRVSDLPIIATMSFERKGHTMMGVSPAAAAARLLELAAELGITAIGANCGNGIEDNLSVLAALHAAAPDAVLVVKSNAGLPQNVPGQGLVYDGTPEVMAEYARTAQETGARIIGGCCGSTPAHIKAMAEMLGDKVRQ